jgi:hypothetical protein
LDPALRTDLLLACFLLISRDLLTASKCQSRALSMSAFALAKSNSIKEDQSLVS